MEFIDNHPVVAHQVRFADRTEIIDQDAEHVRDGVTVVWIVQSVCQPPSYHPVEKDSEDRYRFNVQKVQRAAVLTGVLREQAIAYLDDPDQRQGYFGFEAPRHEAENDDEPEVVMAPDDWLTAEPQPWPADRPMFELDDPSREVVGSLYRPGHESPTQKLLRETWGDQ